MYFELTSNAEHQWVTYAFSLKKYCYVQQMFSKVISTKGCFQLIKIYTLLYTLKKLCQLIFFSEDAIMFISMQSAYTP